MTYIVDYSVDDLKVRLEILEDTLSDVSDWDAHNDDVLNEEIAEIKEAIRKMKILSTGLQDELYATQDYAADRARGEA